MLRKKKRQPIPRIKYLAVTDEGHPIAHETMIHDEEGMISLYVMPHEQHHDRFVCETYEVDCLVANVDINNKGNIQGIEVVLRRKPGQEPRY